MNNLEENSKGRESRWFLYCDRCGGVTVTCDRCQNEHKTKAVWERCGNCGSDAPIFCDHCEN